MLGNRIRKISNGENLEKLKYYHSNHEIVEIAQNIEKLASIAVKDKEEKLKTILFSVADGVIATDRKGIVEFVNPVAKAHINRLEDRIVGRKIEEIFDIYSETDNCKVAVGLPKSWSENQYYNKEYYAKMRTQTGAEAAGLLIERITASIEDKKVEGISLSISFGYATKYKPEEKISSIITDSDSNMYSNKITESAIFKKNTIIDFRNALENKHSMTLEDKLRTKKICDVAMIEMGIKGDE